MKKFLVSCLIFTIIVGICVNVSAYTAPDYLKLNVIERTGWTASCKGGYLPDDVKNILDGFARWGADGAAFKLNGGGEQGTGALIGDYIQIDMKSSHIIDKTIIINTFNTPMNRYKIFLSETEITDTTSMTPVATVEGCAKDYEVPSPFNVEGSGNQIIRFAPQSARYIRFEIYENTGWIGIDEIHVGTPWSMPDNIAIIEKTGFSATAIRTYDGYNVNNLFDNLVGTGHNWACEKRKNGDWIAVNMKAPTLTNGIALITNDSPNYKHARSFKVYLSDDEVYTADEIVTTTDSGSEGLTVVSWPDTTKQYMKIEIDKDDGDWWNLDEIEFYSPFTKQEISDFKVTRDMDTNEITLSGTLPNVRNGECITVEVINENDGSTSFVSDIKEFDANKSFKLKFIPLNIIGDSCTLNIKLSGTVVPLEYKVVIKSAEGIAQDIKSCSTAELLERYINDNREIVGLNLADYPLLSADIVKALFNSKDSIIPNKLQQWISETVINVHISAKLLTADVFERLAGNLNINMSEYNLLSTQGKAYFISILSQKNALYTQIAVDLARLHQSENNIILEILEKNNINLTKYHQLSAANKDELFHQLRNENMLSFDDVQIFIDKVADSYVKDQLKPGGGGGGGGGGGSSSGGGGGGNTGYIPPIVENVEPQTPEIVVTTPEEKKENLQNEIVYDLLENSSLFVDLDGFEWAKEAIFYLTQEKIVSGYGDNKFVPDAFVTRAEFIKMMAMALNIKPGASKSAFTDITANHWAFSYIATMEEMQLLSGTLNGEIKPDDNITREDIMVITYRALNSLGITGDTKINFKDKSDISPYAITAVGALCNLEIVNGMENNTIAPQKHCTRAEAAQIIYKAIKTMEVLKNDA